MSVGWWENVGGWFNENNIQIECQTGTPHEAGNWNRMRYADNSDGVLIQYNPQVTIKERGLTWTGCIMKQFRSTPTVGRRLVMATLSLVCAASRAEADEPTQLRMLSYNIHHAEGVDQKLDLERITSVILSVTPDLVGLQEVDQKATRSGSIDQPAELARLRKMNVAFGANIPLQGGHYGNAVLSRFPVASHKNHLLPNFENGEQRGVIAAD